MKLYLIMSIVIICFLYSCQGQEKKQNNITCEMLFHKGGTYFSMYLEQRNKNLKDSLQLYSDSAKSYYKRALDCNPKSIDFLDKILTYCYTTKQYQDYIPYCEKYLLSKTINMGDRISGEIGLFYSYWVTDKAKYAKQMEALYTNAINRPTTYIDPLSTTEITKDGETVIYKHYKGYDSEGQLKKSVPQIDLAKIYFMYYYKDKETVLKELSQYTKIEGVEFLIHDIKMSKNAINLMSN